MYVKECFYNFNHFSAIMSTRLTKNLVELERDQVLSEVKERLNQEEDPMRIFEECKQGMDLVGEKYKNKEYFLAELMLSVIFLEKQRN